MELNLDYATEKYGRIAQALKGSDPAASAGAPESLAPYINGKEPDMAAIIDTVMRTTGHIKCNPRPLDDALITEIYNMCR